MSYAHSTLSIGYAPAPTYLPIPWSNLRLLPIACALLAAIDLVILAIPAHAGRLAVVIAFAYPVAFAATLPLVLPTNPLFLPCAIVDLVSCVPPPAAIRRAGRLILHGPFANLARVEYFVGGVIVS